MKKREIWKVIALFFLTGLMGCGARNDQNLIEVQGKGRSEKITLWSYYETKAQKEGLDKLVKEYNQSQDKYKLSWEYVPMTDFVKNLSFLQSNDKLPDLVLVDNPDLVSLAKIGMLADITEQTEDTLSEEDYYKEVLKSTEFDGRRYGIPYCCNNTAIIYNKKMFREKDLEIPVNWKEFKETAAVLSEKGERYGFAMSAVSGEQGAFQLMPWILSAGADTGDMADEKMTDAFHLVRDLIQADSMPNDCLNWSQNDLTTAFIAGEIAMMENGPWSLAAIEEAGIEYGIFKFPQKSTSGVILGGEVLAVVDGKNVNGAVSFINYYNRENVMEEICGMMKSIPPKKALAQTYAQEYPECRVFVEQMEYGISRKSIKDWKKICSALSESLNKLFGSEESVEDIWKGYVKCVEEDEGYDK